MLSALIRRAAGESREMRSHDYLHVSDLLNRCMRKIALTEQQDMPQQRQMLSLMDSLTFEVGDTIHDVIKRKAGLGGPSSVWGHWHCTCKSLHTETPCLRSEVDMDEVCAGCHTPKHIYGEVPMRDEELKIVGNPDLILFLHNYLAYYITELKSIAHAQWEEMSRPKPEHVIQILFYWYLMRKLGYRVASRVSIFYVTKGYLFSGEPYKEFTFEPEEILSRLEPYLDEARYLLRFRADGTLPPRTQCSSRNAPEAKKCSMCSVCFEENTHAAPIKVSVGSVLRRR